MKIYSPSSVYLKAATLAGSCLSATFDINGSPYLRDGKLSHVAAVEYQLCLNQAIYAYYGLQLDSENEQYSKRVDLYQYLRSHKEVPLALKVNMSMRSPAVATTQLSGRFCLHRERFGRTLYLGAFEFEFGAGACQGSFLVGYPFATHMGSGRVVS